MVRVLLVEDDPAIADITSYFLSAQPGYTVVCAHSGSEALSFARESFDVIIMDILLPDTDGINLCATLRQWHRCPIIFSSALDDTDTIVSALQRGGDDFIVKPYDHKILLARIEANLRRVRMEAAQNRPDTRFTYGPFSMDDANSQARLNGQTLRLSQMEYRLLAWFLHHPDQYATAEEIYLALWGEETANARTVQVHIHNLRKKIEADPSQPRYLRSVWGKGYILSLSQEV